MNGFKGVLESKTVLGGIVVILSGAAGLLGYDFDAELQGQIAGLVTNIVTVIGGAVTIYGRIKASKRIGAGPGSNGNGNSRTLQALFALGLATTLMLSACAGVPQNTCYSRVLATERAIDAAYADGARLLSADVIDVDTAEKVLKSADMANIMAGRAKALCGIDEPTASRYLLESAQLLVEITTFLED